MMSYLTTPPPAVSTSAPPVSRANLKFLTPLMASVSKKSAKGKMRTRDYGKVFDITGVNRPMPQLIGSNQIYRAILSQAGSPFSTNTSTPTYYATSLTLGTLASYSEYVGLFDQYRIKEVEVWIEPNQAATTVASPIWYSAIDLDDSTTPAAIAVVAGKQTATASSTESGHYHRFKPHVAVAEYSGTFTSYGNIPAGWIDSGSPGVEHFGVKVAIPADGVSRGFSFTYRALVEFRQAGI
jgi:hypothetical protein